MAGHWKALFFAEYFEKRACGRVCHGPGLEKAKSNALDLEEMTRRQVGSSRKVRVVRDEGGGKGFATLHCLTTVVVVLKETKYFVIEFHEIETWNGIGGMKRF